MARLSGWWTCAPPTKMPMQHTASKSRMQASGWELLGSKTTFASCSPDLCILMQGKALFLNEASVSRVLFCRAKDLDGIVTTFKIHRLPEKLALRFLFFYTPWLRRCLACFLWREMAKLASTLLRAKLSPLAVSAHRKTHVHFSARPWPKSFQHAPAFCLLWWKAGKVLTLLKTVLISL